MFIREAEKMTRIHNWTWQASNTLNCIWIQHPISITAHGSGHQLKRTNTAIKWTWESVTVLKYIPGMPENKPPIFEGHGFLFREFTQIETHGLLKIHSSLLCKQNGFNWFCIVFYLWLSIIPFKMVLFKLLVSLNVENSVTEFSTRKITSMKYADYAK